MAIGWFDFPTETGIDLYRQLKAPCLSPTLILHLSKDEAGEGEDTSVFRGQER